MKLTGTGRQADTQDPVLSQAYALTKKKTTSKIKTTQEIKMTPKRMTSLQTGNGPHKWRMPKKKDITWMNTYVWLHRTMLDCTGTWTIHYHTWLCRNKKQLLNGWITPFWQESWHPIYPTRYFQLAWAVTHWGLQSIVKMKTTSKMRMIVIK